VLSYSLNNQVGFMVVGVGIGSEMAIDGAVAHVFAHVIYKALLFMSMGAVLLRAGTIKGSALGGLYKSMPWTTCFCIVGAASISAFPLFSGFVSKSLILTAAVEEHHPIAFLVLLFASAGVFHHSGIKIPYFAFFAHDRGLRVKEAPLNMLLAMAGASALCIGIGVYPDPLYRLLPFSVAYEPYSVTHVVTALQLLFFSALAFTVLLLTGLYPPETESVNLDFDWTYRRALPALGGFLTRTAGEFLVALKEGGGRALGAALGGLARLHSPPGVLGEPWSPGTTAVWAALLLAVYLVLYFV
jgi:multicomponent Na+:H+ antiporter subunit D